MATLLMGEMIIRDDYRLGRGSCILIWEEPISRLLMTLYLFMLKNTEPGWSKVVFNHSVSMHIHLPCLGLEGFTPRSADSLGLNVKNPVFCRTGKGINGNLNRIAVKST